MAINTITAIANAISGASKVIGMWMASSERRKMSKAIDAAEHYILINEDIKVVKNKKKRLKYHRKKFFKFNN